MSNTGALPFKVAGATIAGDVTVSPAGLPAYTGTINIYGEVLVPYNTETTIISYLVPIGHTFYLLGLRGSGDTNGEFYVRVDGTAVGYSRTTASLPTCTEDYFSAPSSATAGQIVTLSAIIYTAATHIMRANLMGGII